MAQFYVDDVDLTGQQEIPVDNFYWMTDAGKKLRLVMHAGEVFLETTSRFGSDIFPCRNVPSALRLLGDFIADDEKAKAQAARAPLRKGD